MAGDKVEVRNCSARSLARYHNTADAYYTDVRWRVHKILMMAKNRAKSQDLAFDLDDEYLLALYHEQEGCCALSGRCFNLERSKGTPQMDGPSLDKIKPELGYTKGNVRFVTYHVNVCLHSYGERALKDLCKDILGVDNE